MTKESVFKVLKTIKKIIGTMILVIVLYAVLGNVSALNNGFYNIIHFRNYVVLTGSMEPSISPGDYVTILKVNKDNLKEGDVITYTRDNAAVTHKIVSIDGDTVITQGTANNIADDPITKSDIVGKYLFKVPKVGYIMKFMSSLSGLILIFGFMGIAVFWELTDPERANKNKKETKSNEKEENENKPSVNIEYTRDQVLRDIIFDNLKELGRISKEDEDIILKQCDIEKLKDWSRMSAKASSIDEFYSQINNN